MSKNPAMIGLLAIAMISGGAAPVCAQADKVAQILLFRPKCDDVAYTTPTPAEVAKCNAELFKAGGGSGFLLVDGDKRTLRKFVDSDGDNKLDTWSYYKDGAEVYREAIAGKGYSFRWIGPGGMKWGVGTVDQAGKARIETWLMISADEAAQEAFQALATGDFDRLKALFITPKEIQAVGLPATEGQRLMAQQQNAALKFQKVRTSLPDLPKATFQRLENAKPGAYPTDLTGGTQDIVKIPSGLILFENGPANPKKHDWMNSGELVQVGNVWRLTDVPSPEMGGGGINEQFAKAAAELGEIDKLKPADKTGKLGAWTLRRVEILRKMAEAAKAEDQENWYKQILDNLAYAIVDGDDTLAPVLTKWKTQFATTIPGGNLNMVPYAAYREIWSNYQREVDKLKGGNGFGKIQDKYHEDLAKFIQAYPKAEDTPDALIQIATGSEFAGKEDEAKKWYGQIANFPNSSNKQKAEGAIKRLESIGQPFVLAGPTLNGRTYSLAPGKITVVYYWASYSGQAVGDFATLSKLQKTFGKDLEVVGVNLDENAVQAAAFLKQATPLNAEHLHQPGGGINGKFASDYGIFGLPHLFLIDATGRVVSNKVQVGALEEEIGKLTKK